MLGFKIPVEFKKYYLLIKLKNGNNENKTNFKLFTFIGIFSILFTCLALYTFAANTQIKINDAQEETLSIEGEDGNDYLRIKRSFCINCGACLEIAPEKLEIRDDNKVGKKEDVTSISRSVADELVDACPSDVFSIVTE